MQIHTLEPLLKENPFFEGMEERLLEHLVGCATNLRFDTGQYIFRTGQKADWFFVIRQGQVALEIVTEAGKTILIDTLKAGDVLGWSWLFPPYIWKFDARPLSLTRVIAMDGECIRAKCDANHELGFQLMKRLALVVIERLQSTRLRLIETPRT